jgi:hypothetical protein
MAVRDHNEHKIGVDKSNQGLAYYSFPRKSMKWWKTIFFPFFDLPFMKVYISLTHSLTHSLTQIGI